MHEEWHEELAGEISVERTVTLPAHPEEVWEHLTQGDLLGEWMDGEVTIAPRPGGKIEMTPDNGPTVWGTVEDVIPTSRIQWSWRSDVGLPTQVEIELAPSDKWTRLTVRETLLPWRISGMPPQWIDPPAPIARLSAVA